MKKIVTALVLAIAACSGETGTLATAMQPTEPTCASKLASSDELTDLMPACCYDCSCGPGDIDPNKPPICRNCQ